MIEKIATNLFAHFDREKKKSIDFACFKQIVDIFTLPEVINLDKLRVEFDQADTDHNGQISLNGWLLIYFLQFFFVKMLQLNFLIHMILEFLRLFTTCY